MTDFESFVSVVFIVMIIIPIIFLSWFLCFSKRLSQVLTMTFENCSKTRKVQWSSVILAFLPMISLFVVWIFFFVQVLWDLSKDDWILRSMAVTLTIIFFLQVPASVLYFMYEIPPWKKYRDT